MVRLSLSPLSQVVDSRDLIQVSIQVDRLVDLDYGQSGLLAGQFSLAFDPNLLTLERVETASVLGRFQAGDVQVGPVNTPIPGYLFAAFTGTQGLSEEEGGILLNVIFRLTSAAVPGVQTTLTLVAADPLFNETQLNDVTIGLRYALELPDPVLVTF